MKLSVLSETKDYSCQYEWPEDCFIQGCDSGVVFSSEGVYTTCFVEAFPKRPSTFIRGEGKTLQEAEDDAWAQYQRTTTCQHPSFDRKGYKNGAAFCVSCNMFKSKAFEPLTRCTACDKPTNYTSDINGTFYCEDHPVPDELEFKALKTFRSLKAKRENKSE